MSILGADVLTASDGGVSSLMVLPAKHPSTACAALAEPVAVVMQCVQQHVTIIVSPSLISNDSGAFVFASCITQLQLKQCCRIFAALLIAHIRYLCVDCLCY